MVVEVRILILGIAAPIIAYTNVVPIQNLLLTFVSSLKAYWQFKYGSKKKGFVISL